MFGNHKPKNGMFFGSNGAMANLVGNTAFVSGTGKNDGVYTRCGNSIMGPNGVTTVIGNGATQTAIGPDGVHTIINNGSTSTVMGPDGVHSVFHNPSGGGTVF